MQKRKIELQYGNANDDEIEEGYTFILPGDKYKNININLKKEEQKDKDKKEKKKRNEKN